MLTYLSEITSKKRFINTFYGYNHTLTPADGAFWDISNMTADNFPVLTTRKRRTLTGVEGARDIVGKEKLGYVKDGAFYYDGQQICAVTDGEKQIISMGAYILIFPDKLRVNTYTGEYDSLEAEQECTDISIQSKVISDGTVSYTKEWVRISAESFADFSVGDGITLTWTYNSTEQTQTTVIDEMNEGYCDVSLAADDIRGLLPASDIKIARTVPDMDFYTECDNRVWGCSSEKHEIYCCKLGDARNWNCFAGISTDSYAVTVGSDGPFTGAASYLGYVLFFKEHCVHKIYGTKPANFQITETECRGVHNGSHRSLAVVDEVLYYHSTVGIMAYTGEMPNLISDCFGDVKYKNGVAGGYGGKYYIRLEDNTGSKTLFCFDTARQTWHKDYGETDVISFARTADSFYMLLSDGSLYHVDGAVNAEGTSENPLHFLAETGEFGLETPNRKHISKIQLRLLLKAGSTLQVFISCDGGDFETKGSLEAQDDRNVTLPIIPRRCDRLKIRLEGDGEIELYSMAFTQSEGSEI